ncbi:helix-turn-helix domain-containing protein [Maritalea sp.]|uniref:helix-turn-helix domain-containing protein n=1 Tax=Maritalea sp. TaxID=2003361 RepID=UPI003EF56C1F
MMHVLSSNTKSNSGYSVLPMSDRLEHSNYKNIDMIIGLVAAVNGVSAHDIRCTSRSRAHIAFCRQVAMYLAHVALGYSLTKTGVLFRRDRTTVSHACARIEDLRDNREFDAVLTSFEQILKFAITQQPNCKKSSAQ